jgi:inosine-uridine nucleoside N-ribohydrolase
MASDRKPYILDVDTGIDDALALALAVNSPEVDLLAVTTLAGNVDITQTTDNTRRVLTLLGATDVPVHRGASRPLAKKPLHAAHVHGSNGLGNAVLPEGTNPIGPDRGPAAIIRMATQRPGEITLVCVGPLTNLAIALNVEPCLPSLLKRVVIMGGAFFNRGNVTEHAEFNIYADPEAAAQVFETAFPDLTVVGLDVTHQATLSRAAWERAGTSESASARLAHLIFGASFTERGLSDCYLHDPMALAIAMDPTLATYLTGQVSVEPDSERRGKTTLTAGSAGARIAELVEVNRFMALFGERMDLIP